MSEMDDWFRQKEEAHQREAQRLRELLRSIAIGKDKKPQEIKEHDERSNNPNWGTFT